MLTFGVFGACKFGVLLIGVAISMSMGSFPAGPAGLGGLLQLVARLAGGKQQGSAGEQRS